MEGMIKTYLSLGGMYRILRITSRRKYHCPVLASVKIYHLYLFNIDAIDPYFIFYFHHLYRARHSSLASLLNGCDFFIISIDKQITFLSSPEFLPLIGVWFILEVVFSVNGFFSSSLISMLILPHLEQPKQR